MSVKRPRLDHPAVITVIASALLAVAALNLWTFRQGSYAYGLKPSRNAVAGVAGVEAVNTLIGMVDPGEAPGSLPVQKPADFRWPRNSRDPFRAAAGGELGRQLPEPGLEIWRCEAVVLHGSYPIALINGRSYRIGDSVNEAVVVGIDAGGVTLFERNREIRLAVVDSSTDETSFTVVMAGPTDRLEETTWPLGHGDHGGER